MMKTPRYLMAIAALSLASAPAFAAPANPAASLSVASSARVGTVGAHKNKLAGGGLVVALIAAAAVVAGIVIIANNKDNPSSP